MIGTSVRLADYVADFVATNLGVKTVFTVTGGGAMYLNDAFGKHARIKYIPMHHEQTASMAAEGYYRETGCIAVCQVTTGPGGTNAVTGCAGAWVDSEAVLFISGQVESVSIANIESRQTGVQELDIVSMVKGITKASVKLTDPTMIRYELERLTSLATSGRFGPVWIDIPLDLQNFKIDDIEKLPSFKPLIEDKRIANLKATRFRKAAAVFKASKRPLILIGNGCRHAIPELLKFLSKCNVPVITGWNGRDIVGNSSNLILGSAGLFGNRAANLAVQKSDLLLGLGYRFSVPQIGYDPSYYAPDSTVVSVEIDHAELTKIGGFIDLPLNSSVEDFISYFNKLDQPVFQENSKGWLDWCEYLKNKNFDPSPNNKEAINSFDFNVKLSDFLFPGDTIVTDMGTSFTCTHQDLKLKPGVKLFTSSGVAAMGFGLPGAIGCSHGKLSSNSQGRTILISGDGGLMFNLQELQTIVTFGLNIKIIIYENGGYLTMKHMQEARFNRLVGSEEGSYLQCADFKKISNAFGIEALEVSDPLKLSESLNWLFEGFFGPRLLVVHLNPWQALVPRVQTRSDETGRLLPPSIDQMFPELNKELEAEVIENYRLMVQR